MQGERNYTIDIVKGLAILSVIADHCHIALCSVIDYFEVPAFFIISGILLPSQAEFWRFVQRKATRLIPPYFVYAILFIIVTLILGGVPSSPSAFVLALAKPSNAPLWFLKALFWSLLLWRLCLPLMRTVTGGVVVTAAAMAAGIGIGYLRLPELLLMTGLPQGLQMLGLVCLGFLVDRPLAKERIPRVVSLISGTTVLMVAFFLVHGAIHVNVCDIGSPLVFYPFVALVFTGAYLAVQGVGRLRPLEYVGRNSLPLFCLHYIVIYILESVGITDILFLFPLTTAITLALCPLRNRLLSNPR